MPSGVPYIVGNEVAERFSFYGMKAVLAIFLTKHLVGTDGQPDFLSEESARAAIAWFTASAYLTPFVGALIADRWWGKYKTILYLSLFYCLGHGALALIDTPVAASIAPRWIMAAGLVLIALGAGGIKPCVTSHVGDQFGDSNKQLLSKVYGWFYFSINLGAFSSQLLTPWLLNEEGYGPAWAFGVPGVLMALATLVFWLGRHRFVHVPPAGPSVWREFFGPEGRRAMTNLTPLLLFVAMFWSLFDQTASSWVLQADNMERTLLTPGVTRLFGETIYESGLVLTPSQTQAANPIFVLLFVPTFSLLLYPSINRVFRLTPLRKIGIGMFVAAGSFAVSALIEQSIQSGHTPTIYWQFVAYAVLTAAEVFISITMLEFFYTQAPRRMKSIMMAFCMLSISIGNVFTALVNQFIQREDGIVLLPGASYYWFFVTAMLVVAVGYVFWAPTYRGQTYLQGSEEPLAENG